MHKQYHYSKGDVDISLSKLQEFDILSGLDEEELWKVKDIMYFEKIKKRQPISLRGKRENSLNFVLDGHVKLSCVDAKDGREVILSILRSGQMFTLLHLPKKSYLDYVAMAIQDCVVGHICESDFRKLNQEIPDLFLRLYRHPQEDVNQKYARHDELLFRDIPTRLARLLIRLGKEYPGTRSAKNKIDLKLTQQEMANLIGATREMVSLSLNDFRRQGWVDMRQRRILLLDKGALHQMAA